jgi:Big-like domain-containing protein
MPLDARIALRFSQPLRVESLTTKSVSMTGPDGPITVTIVPAERGRIAFVSPRVPLAPAVTHTLTIDGGVDQRGVRTVTAVVTLSTIAARDMPEVTPDPEEWTPSAGSRQHGGKGSDGNSD